MPIFHGATIGSGVVIVSPTTLGSAGEALISNGDGTSQWGAVGTDPAADYDWTGLHTWSKPIVIAGANFGTFLVNTPAASAVTVNLANDNHQQINNSGEAAPVTVTLQPPTGAASGILQVQHGATPQAITWQASSGSIVWWTTEPDLTQDAANSTRPVSWFSDGTNIYLMSTATVGVGGGNPSVGAAGAIQVADGLGAFADGGATLNAGDLALPVGKQLTADKIESTAIADLILTVIGSGNGIKLQTANGINALQTFGLNAARVVFGPGTDDGVNPNQFYGQSGGSAVAAHVYTNAAGNKGVRIKGAMGQTANRFEVVDSNDGAFFIIGANNELYIFNLPTSDPANANQLWSNAGVLTLSSG